MNWTNFWSNFTWPLSYQTLGLIVFLIMAGGTQAILAYDLSLELRGFTTISSYTRAHPWLAFVILSALGFGNVGLAVHFMSSCGKS